MKAKTRNIGRCSILLACMMMLALMPAVVFAAPAASLETDTESYYIWLGEKQVTSANMDDILGDGTASYDPGTNTLTLRGYDGGCIGAAQSLTIDLKDGKQHDYRAGGTVCSRHAGN